MVIKQVRFAQTSHHFYQKTNFTFDSAVFRSNKVEQRQTKKDDKKRFDLIEKLYSEANAEIEKEYEQKRKKYKRRSKRNIRDIEDGEELWNFMENSNDSIDVRLNRLKVGQFDYFSFHFIILNR